jgi:guanylate kinase
MDNTHSKLLDLVRHYKMPAEAVRLLSQNPPHILAGITGSGKDAIVQYIQKISNWQRVVNHTTRQPRPDESNGQSYWFVSEEKMLNLLNSDAMIEVKNIHNIQVSGTSLAAYELVLNAGKKPLLRIDIWGAEEILQRVPHLHPVFLLPPSFEIWMQRLDGRGHMSYVERAKRLHSAKEEMEAVIQNERFILIVNDEVPRVAKEILRGVTDAASQYRNRELAQRLIDHIRTHQ